MSRTAKTGRTRRTLEPVVAKVVVPLGRAVLLEYADEKGRRKVHAFRKGAPLYATRRGDMLVIAAIKVRDKEIHDVT